MIEQAATVIWQLLDAWNSHDMGRVVDLCTEDFEGTNVAEADRQIGIDGMVGSLERYYVAFPDLRFSVSDTVAERDRVAFAWTARGTHSGYLMNIPPTGRPVEVRGVSLISLDAGRIKKALHIWDVAGLLRAIGLLPDL